MGERKQDMEWERGGRAEGAIMWVVGWCIKAQMYVVGSGLDGRLGGLCCTMFEHAVVC
jgi:hypothetical protein